MAKPKGWEVFSVKVPVVNGGETRLKSSLQKMKSSTKSVRISLRDSVLPSVRLPTRGSSLMILVSLEILTQLGRF